MAKNIWAITVGMDAYGLAVFLVRFELGGNVYMVYCQELSNGLKRVRVKSHTDGNEIYEDVVGEVRKDKLGELYEGVKEALALGYKEFEEVKGNL